MTPALAIEAPLDPHALRIVRELPAVLADHAADGRLCVDGRTFELVAEYKKRVGTADAWRVVHMAEQLPKRPVTAALVIADRTTAQARRVLAANGVGYVDALGNAHLEYPGVYIHIETPRRERERPEPGALRLSGKAGVAAQALLLEPEREWGVTDLAKRAGVSVGLAHAVLRRLEQLAIVEAHGDGRTRARTVVDPPALLDLWVEENRDRGVRRLGAYLLPPRGGGVLETVAPRLADARIEHALTGVAAAAMLAPFVTAVPVTTFWVDAAEPLDDVVSTLGAEEAERGANVVLMQADANLPLAFAEERDGVRLANVFRIYYDAQADPRRGRDQAQHFRREVIGW